MSHLPPPLRGLSLPVIGAPMFLVSDPKFVIAQCKAGIVGSFPALNAREGDGEPAQLEAWLKDISETLDRHNQANPDTPAAPFAVNQIVHRSNTRLERDVEICANWNVPIWITSLGAQPWVNDAAHDAGAITLHDVTTNTYARKAVERGADGLILLSAGAGGHTGWQNPFALLREVRAWFDGPLLMAGGIGHGASILGAQAAGADLAYIGSALLAAEEAAIDASYKQMILEGTAEDILTSAYFTGLPANYLKASVRVHGFDPDALVDAAKDVDVNRNDGGPKAWKDIWGAGHGIGPMEKTRPVADLVQRWRDEYSAARADLQHLTGEA